MTGGRFHIVTRSRIPWSSELVAAGSAAAEARPRAQEIVVNTMWTWMGALGRSPHNNPRPVHGFIKLNKLEMAVVSSRPFQRLRYIRQLALTYLVYPGAEHSRFARSLGVMNSATQIFDTLLEKHRDLLGWDQKRVDKNRQLLRLAALLHDIGHAPFSHASEELLGGNDHEHISSRLMSTKPLSDSIDAFEKIGITAKDLVDFFSAESIDPDIAFLREIYSGEIDSDKLGWDDETRKQLEDSCGVASTYQERKSNRVAGVLRQRANQRKNESRCVRADILNLGAAQVLSTTLVQALFHEVTA